MRVAVAVATAGLLAAGAAAQRVACLGDSITAGARLGDPERQGYAARLAWHLGDGAQVEAFGVGGATLLRATDRPYSRSAEFAAALDWRPDVAVVLLGTNDTCLDERRRCWQHQRDLERDTMAIVSDLLEGNPQMRVLLCSPPAMFADASGLPAARAEDLRRRAARLPRVREALWATARFSGCEYHDLTRCLEPGDTSDGVHPTPLGANALAARVAELVRARPAPRLALDDRIAQHADAVTRSEFHDFERLDFTLRNSGARCILVRPHVAEEGYPWLWRARFFGHQPALDLELLDRGFHLAYCDVAGLYGAPASTERWRAFHAFATRLGLNRRPVLLGMSRGGLPALTFAAAEPDLVAALYLDNPVCDLRSWPGGRNGRRSAADWTASLRAWDLREADAWQRDAVALESLPQIASARIPLHLVVGEADTVVPPAENGHRLAARYAELGGPVTRWLKPGSGHHPHGLHPPAPLRRALLRSCGLGDNPAARPLPSAEYRGRAAGWGDGTWWQQLGRMRATVQQGDGVDIAFLGDSITQSLTGAADRWARPDGQRAIDAAFGARRTVDLGLSGDRTEHLLFRIEHGALSLCDPRVIVLQIGANNINAAGHSAAETAEGILAVLDLLQGREPQARVLVCGPFPIGGRPDDPRRRAVDAVHSALAAAQLPETVLYLDLRRLFVDEDGSATESLASDHLHITAAGQAHWMHAISATVHDWLQG